MEIKQENIIAAYNTADDNGKRIIAALFGEEAVQAATTSDKRPVTERIVTFEDACAELGEYHPCVAAWNEYKNTTMACESNTEAADITAYMKLRVICAALNEGWEPEFTEDEWRYYPWFYLYTQAELDDMEDSEKKERRMIDTGDYQTEFAGFGSADSSVAPSSTFAYVGSRLCLRSRELAVYCGKQFIKLWADFNLIRK